MKSRWATPAWPLDLFERTRARRGPIGILRPCVELDPLVGQERRVGRENAVLRAEGHQLVDQLLVLAVQVDLVDQVADPADGPEPLDEVVARCPGTAPASSAGNSKRPALAADLAGDPDRRLARLAIAADPDDLAAFEQVGDVAGIGPVDVDAGQLEPDVGQDRAGHLGVEPPDVRLDVLVGLDVLAGPAVAAAQPIEQPGVDVVADAEAEDPGARARWPGGSSRRSSARCVSPAVGRPSVRNRT